MIIWTVLINSMKNYQQKKTFSIMNNEHITDEDYKHVQTVWETFELKSMGEYHDLYLKSDVLLLTDVFENFRRTCMQYYELDPCHCFTSPGLSWDAMLKMTDIKLELMTDIDMFQFTEKGMRGGVSYIHASGVLDFLLHCAALWERGLRKVGIDLQRRHIGLHRVAWLQ